MNIKKNFRSGLFAKISYIFGIALILASVVTNITPPGTVSAHHATVTGTSVCQSNGTKLVTWKIQNSESGKLMDITSLSRALSGVSVGTVVSMGGFVLGTESVPGTQTNTITLTVGAHWVNGNYSSTNSGSVNLGTACPSATATKTATKTATSTVGVTPDPTATATATNTDQPTATATATNTDQPTATATDQPTATATDQPTATATDQPTATATDQPTATEQPTATDQPTVGVTVTVEETKEPTPTQSDPDQTPTVVSTVKTGRPPATPVDLSISSRCYVTYMLWTVTNPNGFDVNFDWEFDPPANAGSDVAPGNGSVVFYTSLPGTHVAKISYTFEGEESPTVNQSTNGDNYCKAGTQVPTLEIPVTGSGVLIPVTGADHTNLVPEGQNSPRKLMLNLGFAFLGLGLVLQGLSKKI